VREVTGQINFNGHADAVVEITVALVNLASPGMRHGRPYATPTCPELEAAVNAVLEQGRVRRAPLDGRQAEELTEAVARLRTVFEHAHDDPDAAAEKVNELLDELRPTPYLERHDGEPWHLHFHSPDQDAAANWVTGCTVALVTVLGSGHASRLGLCSAPDCDRAYVDTSRNGTRRFCCIACQNRVKAATHRARTSHR
jgi:predicted RNA-binding Zn ribbon-like protein